MFGINATVYEKSDKPRVEGAAYPLPRSYAFESIPTDQLKVQTDWQYQQRLIITFDFYGEIINQISMLAIACGYLI